MHERVNECVQFNNEWAGRRFTYLGEVLLLGFLLSGHCEPCSLFRLVGQVVAGCSALAFLSEAVGGSLVLN